MPGLPIYGEKIDNLIFNKYSVEEEKFALFSNKNIELSELNNFDKLRVGIVEDDYNAEWILDFFKIMNINAVPIFAKNYKILDQLLENNEIDLMVDSAYKTTTSKIIYEFVGHQVYIAGNENSSNILEKIDKEIEYLNSLEYNPISKLYDSYFNKSNKIILIQQKILITIVFILSSFTINFFIIPFLKKNRIKSKIKSRIKNNKYLLQYQPIYNPRNKDIVGFESLLRLVDNNKLIPPFKFISEIEENNMLFDISLWILEKVTKDYIKIKSYNCMNGKDFYISINLSLNELENDTFIINAIKILSESNLGTNKICLEIIERVRTKELDKITQNIITLKNAGFKIAIDDFGMEYSNLDVLNKLDADIIKIDKHFVDGIGKDVLRNEIVLFISKIAQAENKDLVLEGVEEEYQDNIIKKIKNNSLYTQGYFYNKPMYIKDIKHL